MERHGFVHDMLDVKVLILYIMARVAYPVDLQKIYELSYQDDGLSYLCHYGKGARGRLRDGGFCGLSRHAAGTRGRGAL